MSGVATAPRATALTRPPAAWAGPGLVLAATCFNVVLCFVNTRHWAEIGNGPIAAVSLLIVGTGLLLVRAQLSPGLVQSAVLVALGVLALKLLNNGLDLKILFDLAIAPVFCLLGRRSSPAVVERLLLLLMAIVIPVGLVELLLPDQFQDTLDILGFYTNKGAVSADAISANGSRFFASAERAENAGRTLLPQLFGAHRVSSVFLEPISMGNFPLICLAWLLAATRRWTLARLLLAACIALCVVLPDSRQAAATCVMLLALRAGPWSRSRLLAALLPPVVLAAMLVAGAASLAPGEAIGIATDDVQGRLAFSAKLLASWDWPEWFALAPSELYTADTGYGYLVNNLGLPLALLVWATVASAPASTPQAAMMRTAVALYIATSLCVGASMVSIKTAALLWFLYGAATADPA